MQRIEILDGGIRNDIDRDVVVQGPGHALTQLVCTPRGQIIKAPGAPVVGILRCGPIGIDVIAAHRLWSVQGGCWYLHPP